MRWGVAPASSRTPAYQMALFAGVQTHVIVLWYNAYAQTYVCKEGYGQNMRLYLDNCCFNRPFDEQLTLTVRLETEAKLHIQDAICAGTFALGWSYVLDYENAANPFEERRTEIQRWEVLADSFVIETTNILTTMHEMVGIGLKPLDALHIACAVALECQYFLTVDKGILKKSKGITEIQIVNPVDFVIEQGL